MTVRVLVVMGVAGSGKTTVGAHLAHSLGWAYADADSFHAVENVAKMVAGQPLSDEERGPWLQAIRSWIDERIAKQESAVVSCSALRRAYRDVLRLPEVSFVYLRGTQAEIATRMAARAGHFFKPRMLNSQFEVLEEPAADEQAITVAIDRSPGEIVTEIKARAGLQG